MVSCVRSTLANRMFNMNSFFHKKSQHFCTPKVWKIVMNEFHQETNRLMTLRCRCWLQNAVQKNKMCSGKLSVIHSVIFSCRSLFSPRSALKSHEWLRLCVSTGQDEDAKWKSHSSIDDACTSSSWQEKCVLFCAFTRVKCHHRWTGIFRVIHWSKCSFARLLFTLFNNKMAFSLRYLCHCFFLFYLSDSPTWTNDANVKCCRCLEKQNGTIPFWSDNSRLKSEKYFPVSLDFLSHLFSFLPLVVCMCVRFIWQIKTVNDKNCKSCARDYLLSPFAVQNVFWTRLLFFFSDDFLLFSVSLLCSQFVLVDAFSTPLRTQQGRKFKSRKSRRTKRRVHFVHKERNREEEERLTMPMTSRVCQTTRERKT